MSDGSVLRRGVLVAQVMGFYDICFVYCDTSSSDTNPTATYRKDQIRCEPSPADRLELIIRRLKYKAPDVPPRFGSRGMFRVPTRQPTTQELVDYETGLAIVELLRNQTVPSVPHEIITETPDGLRRDDPVNIVLPEGRNNVSASGRFVAEFKGQRYVIFDSGGTGAYPAKDVTKK